MPTTILFEVGNAPQFARDELERLGADLTNVAGQHQRDGRFLRELPQFSFEPGQVRRPQAGMVGEQSLRIRMTEVLAETACPPLRTITISPGSASGSLA